MKNRVVSLGMLLLMLTVLLVQSGLAATVDGHAYKDGQTDHSGITINLEPVNLTPSIGVTGLLLLVLGFSFFLLRKRSRAVMIPMVVCIVAGLSCLTYAATRVSTVTNSPGEYDFADVEPGDYSIDASAPGYYPEHIASFTVSDGANTAPDITLYPGDAGDLISTDPIVGNMRYVPGGTFTQGSPGDEPCRYSDETQFTHTLTRDLAVMETEVTRQMWADLRVVQPSLPADPSDTGVSSTMAHPVQRNTWYEAVLFANLLSLQNGYTRCYYKDAGFTTPVDVTNYTSGAFHCDFDAKGYRLPSEGEWEYFCRAGTSGPFSATEPNYSGAMCSTCSPSPALTVLNTIAWWCGNASGTAHPAGTKAANPWNLKDVHGNVWEWCWDWYSALYPSGSATDYTGPASGSYRVRRGGGSGSGADYCRSAFRGYRTPDGRNLSLGFRLLNSNP